MTDRTYELDRRHVFHSWSAQATLDPMVVTKAEGTYIWDQDDNRLLDFTSQLVYTNLGHQHPRIVAAIQEQAATLCTVAPQHANATRSEAARLIASHTPDGLDKVFFTNGGADANEHAVRMARLHTGRPKVLTTYRSYHGGTQLAINMTGDQRRWANDSASAGTVHFFGPYPYRSPFHSTSVEEECERALAHLEQTILFEGPETFAAVVLESIPGTEVKTVERCAGHDGTWGVKTEYFDNSMKIGRPVFRMMAEPAPDYVSSDCPIAARHIKQGMGEDGARAEKSHPLSLLRKAYGI